MKTFFQHYDGILFTPGFVQFLESMESPGILLWQFPGLECPGKRQLVLEKRQLVLENSGNLLNSSKKLKFMVNSKEN